MVALWTRFLVSSIIFTYRWITFEIKLDETANHPYIGYIETTNTGDDSQGYARGTGRESGDGPKGVKGTEHPSNETGRTADATAAQPSDHHLIDPGDDHNDTVSMDP
jgi:hypothetical protein